MDLIENFLITTAIEIGLSFLPSVNIFEAFKPIPVVRVHREDTTKNVKSVFPEVNVQDKSKIDQAQEQARKYFLLINISDEILSDHE
jgi:hypothetical protein